jgi:hypothetical protein
VWTSRAVTKEVMSAAEEPRPVFATSASATPVGLKGGICASEASSEGKPRLLSCRIETEEVVSRECERYPRRSTMPGPAASKSRYLQRL